jgi:Ni/Co efflux regulator RcnB
MKRTLLLAAAAALALSTTAASAQPYRDHDRSDRHDNRYDSRDNRDNRYDSRDNYDHRDNGHHWRRGQRLDHRYHSRSYIVTDYHRYGWRAPPRGYAYYRTDNGDVVLAAIATGVISSVIANALSH